MRIPASSFLILGDAGSDITGISNVASAAACCEACYNYVGTEQCLYWTWKINSKKCWLKATEGPLVVRKKFP